MLVWRTTTFSQPQSFRVWVVCEFSLQPRPFVYQDHSLGLSTMKSSCDKRSSSHSRPPISSAHREDSATPALAPGEVSWQYTCEVWTFRSELMEESMCYGTKHSCKKYVLILTGNIKVGKLQGGSHFFSVIWCKGGWECCSVSGIWYLSGWGEEDEIHASFSPEKKHFQSVVISIEAPSVPSGIILQSPGAQHTCCQRIEYWVCAIELLIMKCWTIIDINKVN